MGKWVNRGVTVENFWESVNIRGPDECWPAVRNLNKYGYLSVPWRNRKWMAHSLVYYLANGEKDKNFRVFHDCNNKVCCNLRHLYLGTSENFRIRLEKKLYENIEIDPETKCWIFKGLLSNKGYGYLRDPKNKKISTHRLSYEIHYGPIAMGMEVCHSCDTPACIFIDHLRLDTHQGNMQECARKGRLPGYHKLTPYEIVAIREEVKGEKSQREIAEKYNVHQVTVSLIKRNKIWQNIGEDGTILSGFNHV